MDQLLSSVRVLDLTQFLAGPFGAMLLGDMGAEVIKIELPGRGDPMRQMPPHFLAGESAYFLRKEMLDDRCFTLMYADIHFDRQYNVIASEVRGGRLISREEFEAGV